MSGEVGLSGWSFTLISQMRDEVPTSGVFLSRGGDFQSGQSAPFWCDSQMQSFASSRCELSSDCVFPLIKMTRRPAVYWEENTYNWFKMKDEPKLEKLSNRTDIREHKWRALTRCPQGCYYSINNAFELFILPDQRSKFQRYEIYYHIRPHKRAAE